MKIRSITYLINPGWPLDLAALETAGQSIAFARLAFERGGFTVETTRLATTPFSMLIDPASPAQAIEFAQSLERQAVRLGFEYASMGPCLVETPDLYLAIPEILAVTQEIFCAGGLTTSHHEVSLEGIRACAEVILRNASLSPDGFANLRFAALANVPAGSPFFPAAYHSGSKPAFAVATEAADIAVEAFMSATDLTSARQGLISAVETYANRITEIAEKLSEQFGIQFGGIDFSLAPFPQVEQSLGCAFERLGVPAVGLHGSLAAAALIADALDRANFQRAGFSGLMLPVLEDAVLAQRVDEGLLDVTDLLLYSTVCGTGLDTIPLPGDTTQNQLYAVLLDLASLALRLDKPLTARLMPIPGKIAGERTSFDLSYFANSRIMSLKSHGVTGLLQGDEEIPLSPRKRGQG
jgi:hypothetical protein